MRAVVYDMETFKDCCLLIFKEVELLPDGKSHEFYPGCVVFEISKQVTQLNNLKAYCRDLYTRKIPLIGFNNLTFDWPIMHKILTNGTWFNCEKIHEMGGDIIQNFNKFDSPPPQMLKQIDLFRLCNLKSNFVSLKQIEFLLRFPSIKELPFDPAKSLTIEDKDTLLNYGMNDVLATTKFAMMCEPLIRMRYEMLEKNIFPDKDVLNFSDIKIGEEYMIGQIGRDNCFHKNPWGPKQTLRKTIKMNDIILPKIKFGVSRYQDFLDNYKKKTISLGDNISESVETSYFPVHFGLGGLHGAVEKKQYFSSDMMIIRDIDVTGMYPSVTVANGFAPEHMAGIFSEKYKDLVDERKKYPKGSIMSGVLKLAANGIYGKSRSKYSCFYDPQYTYSVTVNGQFLLFDLFCRIEYFFRNIESPSLSEIIQTNTDGITLFMDKDHISYFNKICKSWENFSGLSLEHKDYKMMHIKDVNNYIAVDMEGNVKTKGAYFHPKVESDYFNKWNGNYSSLVIQKAAEKFLVHGQDPYLSIISNANPCDFMIYDKTRGVDRNYIGETPMGKITRLYASTQGEAMSVKRPAAGPKGAYKRKNGVTQAEYDLVMSENGGEWNEKVCTKNKSVYTERSSQKFKGYRVKECNDVRDFNFRDLDYDYYHDKLKDLIHWGV